MKKINWETDFNKLNLDVDDDHSDDALYCSTRHSSWPIRRFEWWAGPNGYDAQSGFI